MRVVQFRLLFCFEPFAIFMAALKKLSPQGAQRSTGDIKIPTLFRKWRERRVGHPRVTDSGGIRRAAWLGSCRRPRRRIAPARPPTFSESDSRTAIHPGPA